MSFSLGTKNEGPTVHMQIGWPRPPPLPRLPCFRSARPDSFPVTQTGSGALGREEKVCGLQDAPDPGLNPWRNTEQL